MKKLGLRLGVLMFFVSVSAFGMNLSEKDVCTLVCTENIDGDHITSEIIANKAVITVFKKGYVGSELSRVLVLDIENEGKLLFDSQGCIKKHGGLNSSSVKLVREVDDQIIIQNKKVVVKFKIDTDTVLYLYDLVTNKTTDFTVTLCDSVLKYFFSEDTNTVIIEHGTWFDIYSCQGEKIGHYDILFENSDYKLYDNGLLFVEGFFKNQHRSYKKLKVLDIKNHGHLLFDSEKCLKASLNLYGYRVCGKNLFISYAPDYTGNNVTIAPTKLVVIDLERGGKMLFQTDQMTKYHITEQEKLIIEYKYFDNQGGRFKNKIKIVDLEKTGKQVDNIVFNCVSNNFFLTKDKNYMILDTVSGVTERQLDNSKQRTSQKKLLLYKLFTSPSCRKKRGSSHNYLVSKQNKK